MGMLELKNEIMLIKIFVIEIHSELDSIEKKYHSN